MTLRFWYADETDDDILKDQSATFDARLVLRRVR